MKDRIFYQSDSSGNVGAHDIKGSRERQKKGATSAASNQGRRHPLGNPDKTVPTDLRNDISRRLSKACCSAYIVELVLYGNHGLLFRASEIYQYFYHKRKKFLGIPKSFGITSSMLYGRKLLVSHPRLNPPMGFLNACSRKCILLGEAYILIHTYNVHSGRLSQFCPHLFNSGGLLGLLNRFGPWKLEVK